MSDRDSDVQGAADDRLTAEGKRDAAAMNARTYAMSPEDRERWFAGHPVSMFEEQE